MAQWRIHYMLKEVHLLSGPSELQLIIDYTTQYTHKGKDLPQLSSTSEAQHTHREPATAISQALTASCKLWVDQRQNGHQHQNGYYTTPKVYRRTRSMLKIRSTDFQQTRHNYSQLTDIEKKLSFKTHSLIMMRETLSSTILSRKYQMILSTQQKILPLLLYFQN